MVLPLEGIKTWTTQVHGNTNIKLAEYSPDEYLSDFPPENKKPEGQSRNYIIVFFIKTMIDNRTS